MKNLEIQKAAKSYEKSSFSYKKLLLLAAEEGFEPSQTESELPEYVNCGVFLCVFWLC